MLNTASQPIYNSSTGGSSLQLNSSYNYPPTSAFHSTNKFGTLTNGSTNLMLNQSLNNVTPFAVNSTAHLNSLNSIGGSTALATVQPAKKHVMFVGDTPPHSNPSADNIQLLPVHTNSYLTNSYTSSLAQPIYNQDLNVADVFYGTVNNSTLPMKLPRLNYMSNSRINLNNSLNNQLNTSALANQQAANQQQAYFPVVSLCSNNQSIFYKFESIKKIRTNNPVIGRLPIERAFSSKKKLIEN